MREVYVNKYKKRIELIIVEDNDISEYYDLDDEHSKSLEGNIYVGIVRNVVEGMQSFFIDIGQKKNGFLFFNDLQEKQDGIYKKDEIDNIKVLNKLNVGQRVLVQVKKEPIGTKGAKLTTDISLIGRYVILTPKSHFIALSKKIIDEDKRKEYVTFVKSYLTNNYGAIIRTNIEETTQNEVKEEIESLIKKWEKLRMCEKNIFEYKEPTLVYEEERILFRTIKDVLNKELKNIYVNDKKYFELVKEIVISIDEKYLGKMKFLDEDDILDYYGMRKKLLKDFDAKIWLKCGGYLIINKTEALTAIDVNTGKYVGKKDLENTVFIVNKEAVKEIARQMRLRNMEGIIVVDFIDMNNEKHKDEILELLKEEIKKDRSKVDVKGYTKLNLMEITRKKKKN